MEKPIITFPCEFPIKIIGLANDTFEGKVVAIINQYVPDLGEGALRVALSSNRTYMSITVTLNAQSQEQLDGLYRTLSAHPDTLMVL